MSDPTIHRLTPEQFKRLLDGQAIAVGDPDSQVTLAKSDEVNDKKYGSLDELSADVMAPMTVRVELKHGSMAVFTVRALNADQAAVADDMGKDLMPPKKVKPVLRGVVQPEEYDWEDVKYQAEREKVMRLKQAYVITNGLIGFEVPGSNLQEKSDALRRCLPPRALQALHAQVLALTSDPVKTADFS